MGFSEFLGNQRVVAALQGALRSGRVPHALLFTGPRGVGKFTLARMFAQAANCERLTGDFCGQCHTCQRIALLADPQKLIEILWKDDQGKRFPKEVLVGGIENGNYAVRSLWQTTYGIGLGMPLKSLEKINRRPFRLAGFGWDDEGTVHSWSGGILEKAFGSKSDRKVFIRLNPDNSHLAEVRQVSGDADFSSGHPAMQTINPQIFQMIFVFSRN